MKTITRIVPMFLLLLACNTDSKKETAAESKTKMLVTHYYSIKKQGDSVVKDTLKECFSCNQALVYDESGKEVELRFYKSNMKDTYGYEVYNYDSEGRKTGSNYYENDSLTTKYRYTLDDKGRILVGKAYDAKTDKMLYGYQNKYDVEGNHVETGSMNSEGEIGNYYRRKFNDKGIVMFENIEDTNGNPTFRVKYEYRPKADSLWTEQLTYYNDTLKEIRFRERIRFNKE